MTTHNKPFTVTQPLTRELKQQAEAMGIDLFGVAPVERFETPAPFDEEKVLSYTPSGFGPTELLPGVRSVVVLGIRQLTGVLESAVADPETTYAFGNFGYVHLNRTMNTVTYTLAKWLEDRSWTTLPLGSALASRFESDASPGGNGGVSAPLKGIFSMKRAAVLAGLGSRAKNGLVATPAYGTQVRLGALLTTASLEATPLIEGDPCPPGCTICMDVCPTEAITTEGRVDHVRCFSDCGRRGATYETALENMRQRSGTGESGQDYVQAERDAIDSTGNRLCRAACMALCPLGESHSPELLSRIRTWQEKHPKIPL